MESECHISDILTKIWSSLKKKIERHVTIRSAIEKQAIMEKNSSASQWNSCNTWPVFNMNNICPYFITKKFLHQRVLSLVPELCLMYMVSKLCFNLQNQFFVMTSVKIRKKNASWQKQRAICYCSIPKNHN